MSGDNLVITGGEDVKDLTPDPVHVSELYVGLRRAGVGKIQCSRRTFREHLEFNTLMVGPWDWDLKDDVPFGDLYLFDRNGKRLGTATVSSLVLN